MRSLTEKSVVSCFIVHGNRLLLLRRSGKVGSYKGRWGVVAGHLEKGDEAIIDRAYAEIEEEASIPKHDLTLIKQAEPFYLDAPELGVRWHIHPFLFESRTDNVTLDWEHTDHRWICPETIDQFETVPNLKYAFSLLTD